ncbi:MAG: hypothetical protein U0P82_08085 [Vicinamibacterales bacterium]
MHRLAGALALCLLTTSPSALAQAAQDPARSAAGDQAVPLFRVFMKDGSSLVSYGEFARLDDSVVFSMPTTTSVDVPQLQLINIPSDRVDWPRTLNYAESVRASRYLATRAQADYEQLSGAIAQALNDVGQASDARERLAIVERARKTLAEWPGSHHNYKRDEIQQMLGTLDEAIASLKASSGASTFDLTFVAASDAPSSTEPILPAPGARETIEQTLKAADLTPSPAERMALLTVAANTLDAEFGALPAEWAASTMSAVQARIQHELEIDREYQALSARMLRLATARARQADVRGVQRVLASIHANDEVLGSLRPDSVAAMSAAVEEQLEAAQQLRLERDRWALRAPELRAYRNAMAIPLFRLQRMTPLLEDIKALAGSGPDAIGAILRSAGVARDVMATVAPPQELQDLHTMLLSAVQLAENAAKIRREAAINASMPKAWDASSAAAGALMLAQRARVDLQKALQPPQLAR